MLILKSGWLFVWLIYPTNIYEMSYSVVVIITIIMVNKKDMAMLCKEIAC